MDPAEKKQLLSVIGDFLELGHVENIMAMFRKDPDLYALTGELVADERFTVRLGTAVLFEELSRNRPGEAILAIPALLPLLGDDDPRLRGEAANILGIIGSSEALKPLAVLVDDPDPQVREIAVDALASSSSVPRE